MHSLGSVLMRRAEHSQLFHKEAPAFPLDAFSLLPAITALLKALKILEHNGRLCKEKARLTNLTCMSVKQKAEDGETNTNRKLSGAFTAFLCLGMASLKSNTMHTAIYHSPADYGHFRVQLWVPPPYE